MFHTKLLLITQMQLCILFIINSQFQLYTVPIDFILQAKAFILHLGQSHCIYNSVLSHLVPENLHFVQDV